MHTITPCKPMRWQIINAVAAAASAAIWFDAIVSSRRLHAKAAAVASTVALATSVWYAAVYLALAAGMWRDDIGAAVPLFRYVFVVAILAPPIRHLALRKARQDLAELHAPVQIEES